MLFSCKIPACPEYVGVIRLAISALASRLNFTFEEIEDLKLSVAEACNIIINFSCQDDLVLKAYQEAQGLRLEIYNNKCDLEPADRLKISEDLGFFLIQSLMDEVKLEKKKHSGILITMKKKMLVE